MVPGIQNSPLSMRKFADAKYITIFDKDEVNIYDATNTTITGEEPLYAAGVTRILAAGGFRW